MSEDTAARAQAQPAPEDRAQSAIVDMALPLKMESDEINEAKQIIAAVIREAEQAAYERGRVHDQFAQRAQLARIREDKYELLSIIERIQKKAAPNPGRTFDGCIKDLGEIDDIARSVLKEAKNA